MSKLFKVFVYGTLKTGQPNHHWFSKDCGYFKFLCHATTVKKYPLIIASEFNIPFLLYSPGTGHHVNGEVYEVDEKVLANLDVLEDHPNFYVRELEEVHRTDEMATGQKVEKVWIYFIKNFRPHLLEQKMFDVYDTNGPHGLSYVPRYLKAGHVVNLAHLMLN